MAALRLVEREKDPQEQEQLDRNGMQLERMYQHIDQVYTERNLLVLLTQHLAIALKEIYPTSDFGAGMARDPDASSWYVALVDLPSGQCSWSIHESEMPFFRGIPSYVFSPERPWSGYTMMEDYTRVIAPFALPQSARDETQTKHPELVTTFQTLPMVTSNAENIYNGPTQQELESV